MVNFVSVEQKTAIISAKSEKLSHKLAEMEEPSIFTLEGILCHDWDNPTKGVMLKMDNQVTDGEW